MSNSQNYYKVLRVREDAPENTIKQSFRRLARECHPDLHPDNPEAEIAFKLLQEAYDVLSDRTKRRQYDRLRSFTNGNPQSFSRQNERASQQSQLADHNKIYAQGVQLASQRKYELADKRFSQAIDLKPEFLEAYMGRCQVRYVLGDDRGVLDDCTSIIQLKSQVPQAHYYQGRAKHRLNYVENAIQAYSYAISLDEKYASAYYYRGLARADVRQRKAAISDMKAALQLYRVSGNSKGITRAETKLRSLRKQPVSSPLDAAQNLGAYFSEALVDPVGSPRSIFGALSALQSSQLGFVFAFTSIALVIISLNSFWSQIVDLSWFQLAILGAIPFVVIALTSGILSILLQQRNGNWSGDIFVAGITLLPVAVGSLLTGLTPILGFRFLWALLIGMACMTVMVFYSSLTQVSRMSERQASWVVMFSVLSSVGLIELLYRLF